MALTVSEASAVFDLLHWLGHHVLEERTVDDDRAGAALALLGNHAGKTLQIGVQPGEAREALERHAGRLAAADSDGAAQAVCRALESHAQHSGGIPWPSIRRPYEAWRAARAAADPPTTPTQIDGQLSLTEDHS